MAKKDNEPYVVQYETKTSEFEYARFWDTRSYEDRAERILLKGLLSSYPKRASWLVDIGGSFGRLVEVYSRRFRSLAIADYATNEFYIAKEPAKKSNVDLSLLAANAYHLPFADGSQDALISIRMMHHLEDADKFLGEVHRVLQPGGVAIIEAANKNHTKLFLRSLATFNWKKWNSNWVDVGRSGLQETGSFHLIRNYKPSYLQSKIESAGLQVVRRKSISWLRRTPLTRLPDFMVDSVERCLQLFSGATMMGPSNWYVVIKSSDGINQAYDSLEETLVNPETKKQLTPAYIKKASRTTKGAKYLDLRFPKPRR